MFLENKFNLDRRAIGNLRRRATICSVLLSLSVRLALARTGQTATVGSSIPAQPLPEPAVFLKAVAAKGDRYARLRQDYLCLTQLVIQPNRLSRSQTPVTEEYESFYVNGGEIDRIVKINDVPLSQQAIAEQETRLKQETDAALSLKSKPKPQTPTLEETVLATNLFSNEQRIVRDGRTFISFSFRGDRHRIPQNLIEKIAGSLKGDLLIDETDRVIVEMNGVTQDDVIYNGRFLMPDKFPALVYRAKRINDEIYVPSLVRIAVANDQPDNVLASDQWKRSLELRTYSVDSCRKFHVTSTIISPVTSPP